MANSVARQAFVKEEDLKDLKERMKFIVDADPSQFHDDFSLRRYLRAFKTVDAAFQVIIYLYLGFYLLNSTSLKRLSLFKKKISIAATNKKINIKQFIINLHI